MVKALEPLAQLKKVDWRWDGLHYSKSKRGCGPDREQLTESAPVLKAILQLCPNGFPNLSSLRSVWLQLESRFNILENRTAGLTSTVSFATDVWKKMTKDVVDMARKQVVGGECRLANTTLQELLDMVQQEPSCEKAGASAAGASGSSDKAAAAAAPDLSDTVIPLNRDGFPQWEEPEEPSEEDSDCVMVSCTCLCFKCRPDLWKVCEEQEPALTDEQADTPSASSDLADEPHDQAVEQRDRQADEPHALADEPMDDFIPSAKRGGQKRTTVLKKPAAKAGATAAAKTAGGGGSSGSGSGGGGGGGSRSGGSR